MGIKYLGEKKYLGGDKEVFRGGVQRKEEI
jgi:hypothetical protein